MTTGTRHQQAQRTPRSGTGTTRRRISVNITPVERVGRAVLGGAAVIAGAILLATAGSALAVFLEILLVAAGLDLVGDRSPRALPALFQARPRVGLTSEADMTMHQEKADHSMPGSNQPHHGMGHGGHSWMMMACCVPCS